MAIRRVQGPVPGFANDWRSTFGHLAHHRFDLRHLHPALRQQTCGFDERVQVMTTGVKFDGRVGHVPALTQVPHRLGKPLSSGWVVGELGKQAPTAIERCLRPGHARFGQLHRHQARMRRPTRVQRFDRRSVADKFHHAAGLAQGNAQGSHGLVFSQTRQLGTHPCRGQGARHGAGLKPLCMKAAGCGQTHAGQGLPTPHIRAQHGSARAVVRLGHGQGCRCHHRTAMDDGPGVGVVKLQAVHQAAIDQSGIGGRCAHGLSEHRAGPAHRQTSTQLAIRRTDLGTGRSQAHAQGV